MRCYPFHRYGPDAGLRACGSSKDYRVIATRHTLVVGVYLLVRRVIASPVRKAIVAIREIEARAQMTGYNTLVYKLIALSISGVLAGLAGLMYAIGRSNANPSLLGPDLL